MADLTTNINQAISDFGAIKQAIIDKGIDVPDGTPTSIYSELIGNIKINNNKTDTMFSIGYAGLILPIEDVLISEGTEE